MDASDAGTGQHARSADQLEGAGRFGGRSLLAWVTVVLGVVPFLVLWLLIRDASSPLASFDHRVAAELNEAVHAWPVVVETLKVLTDLADTWTAVVVFTLTTLVLAVQRRWRVAAFVAVTGIGLSILIPVSKAVIGRARPVVEVPLVETPVNASFPSGHAMTAVVLWGTLTLIALPVVRRATRPWLVAALVVLVGVVGFTRLALGVHFLSDVVAGWTMGAAWLAAMVLAFRPWPDTDGSERELDPLQQDDVDLAGAQRPVKGTAVDSRTLGHLTAAAAAIAVVLIALGLLVTGAWGDTWLGRWDRSVVATMAELRTTTLTDIATWVGRLSATSTVVVGGLTLSMLALAASGRWRTVLFVATTLSGEALLYFAVSRIVDRYRPEVADLTSSLPTAASWPSGHAAAAVALYGAATALLLRHGSSGWRRLVVAVPVVVGCAVALSRIYVGAHYPTDVLAGLVLGTAWLLACIRWLLPAARRRPVQPKRRMPQSARAEPPSGSVRTADSMRPTSAHRGSSG